MTSDEIRPLVEAAKRDILHSNKESKIVAAQMMPLWEIAYQLAVLNERYLGSRIGAGPDKTLRGGHQETAPGVPGGIEPYCRYCRVLKRDWASFPLCPANSNGPEADEAG